MEPRSMVVQDKHFNTGGVCYGVVWRGEILPVRFAKWEEADIHLTLLKQEKAA